MKVAITKNAKILALFAIACTAVVGLVHESTKSRIQRQEQAQLISTLQQIVPTHLHDNDMSTHCVKVTDPLLGTTEQQTVYLGTMADKPSSLAITSVAPDGYNGNIHIISAFDTAGNLTGMRVLKHKETPGLGDKVEVRKSDWALSFAGKSAQDIASPSWLVKKDGGFIDQFTGATITPRAVVKAVKNAANYVNEHQITLYKQTNSCEQTQ